MIKAILMDFNGIIIDDERLQMQAYQQILKDEGIDLTEADYFSSLGMDDKTFVEAAFQRADKKIAADKIVAINDAKSAKWREMIAILRSLLKRGTLFWPPSLPMLFM